VAAGMKVALITTIFGIIVAVILQIFYNYILSKIEHLVSQMEDSAITLMDILAKRMRVCREIGEYKKANNMTVLQASRYNEILAKRGAQGSLCGLGAEFVAHVFESIHEESVRQQMEIINK
jgi:chorismate mutase